MPGRVAAGKDRRVRGQCEKRLFSRSPKPVFGAYRTAGTGRVVPHGFQQGRPYRAALDVTLPEREPAH